MESPNPDGFDLGDIDPELNELLAQADSSARRASPLDASSDYPKMAHPRDVAGLAPIPGEGGLEDSALDAVLGNPEDLYNKGVYDSSLRDPFDP